MSNKKISPLPWTLCGQKFTTSDGGQVSLGIYDNNNRQIIRPTVSTYTKSHQAQANLEYALAAPVMHQHLKNMIEIISIMSINPEHHDKIASAKLFLTNIDHLNP